MAAKKKKMDARKLMEQAIEVMYESINEPREDHKQSPMVGAVLYKSDGSVETASRGELRYGDHAEFTLLERKHRSEKLDDAILFATLEPCAPGARKHPKLGCAERIVNARIKTVYVGIEDPDPMVDRKGIKFLQQHGIQVLMFDADLQDEIRKGNKVFLEQALLRAEEAEQEVELLQLSKLEEPKGVDAKDLDDAALLAYSDKLGLSEDIHSDIFHRRLLHQGLLVSDNKNLKPSGFGRLLFAKHPRDTLFQAGLKQRLNIQMGSRI